MAPRSRAQCDVVDAVAVAPDVLGDRVAGDERTREHEPKTVLRDDVGGAIVNAGLGPGVGERLEAECRAIEVCGLFGVADIEFEVIEFERVEGAGRRGRCGRGHATYFAMSGVIPRSPDCRPSGGGRRELRRRARRHRRNARALAWLARGAERCLRARTAGRGAIRDSAGLHRNPERKRAKSPGCDPGRVLS